jgi:hypothetical protein
MALGVLAVSSSYAGACEEIEAQDLNSRIEAALTLAETSGSLDADGQDRLAALREDLSKASDAQTQALESDDEAKLNEVCETYEDMLKQAESLSQ